MLGVGPLEVHRAGVVAELVGNVQRLSQAPSERLDQFFSYGMWLNVAAAMGVPDLSAGCEWISAEAVAQPD